MDRRAFLVVLLAACGCGPNEAPKTAADGSRAAPTGAETPGGNRQSATMPPQPKIPRVSMLVFGARGNSPATAPSGVAMLFRDRLTELGYVEGKTILLEESYADGDPQRLAQLAHEIVASKPDELVGTKLFDELRGKGETGTIGGAHVS